MAEPATTRCRAGWTTTRSAGSGDNDVLFGEGGKDYVRGGLGVDTSVGGAGADKFAFDDSEMGVGAPFRDHISDFLRTDGDKIDLSLVDAKIGVTGDQAFAWKGTGAFTGAGQLRYFTSGSDRIVAGSTDGDTVAEFEIELDNLGIALAGSDFIL